MSRGGRISQPCFHTLWQESGCVTPYFLPLWDVLGFALFDEGFVIKLAWVFCGQIEQKGLMSCSFVSFLDNVKKKNSKAFGDKRQFDQGLKQDFLCNLWVWSNLFIVPRVHSIIDFMVWIGIS